MEQIVDLGAHFHELSEEGQRPAHEDWLDLDHLRSWADGLRDVRLVTPDSALGNQLLSLIEV